MPQAAPVVALPLTKHLLALPLPVHSHCLRNPTVCVHTTPHFEPSHNLGWACLPYASSPYAAQLRPRRGADSSVACRMSGGMRRLNALVSSSQVNGRDVLYLSSVQKEAENAVAKCMSGGMRCLNT
eukprot:109787-Pelagomonas_calceolata.AAC.4